MKRLSLASAAFMILIIFAVAVNAADGPRRVTIPFANGTGTNSITEADVGADLIGQVVGALINYSASTSSTGTFSLVSGSTTNAIDTEVANGTASDSWDPPVVFFVNRGDILVFTCGDTGLTGTVWAWVD